MVSLSDRELSSGFKEHLIELVNQKLGLKLVIGILVLLYFAWSDIYELNNIHAFYTRLAPLGLMLILLFLVWLNRPTHAAFRKVLYNVMLASLAVMMYAKCLVHLNCDHLAAHATGTILIIFLISMEIKTTIIKSALLYFIPLIVFTWLWKMVFKAGSDQYLVLVNIYPIVIIGFFINTIQQELRLKAFKSGMLLEKEKETTDKLYHQAEIRNRHLNEVNEKLTRSEDELKNVVRLRDRFLSIVAHDLRSPFTGLLGLSEVMMRDGDNFSREEIKNYIGEIYESSNSLLSLTDNLLSWAMNQSGELKVNPTHVEVKNLADNVFKVLQVNTIHKSLVLVNEVEDDASVFADSSMLSVIVRNLVCNAMKFSHPGGTVTVKSEPFGERIKLSVRDEGIGISSQKIRVIFNLERNLSAQGTAEETGSGLGLIVCKEFVEKNGGEIEIESKVGKGTSVNVFLPTGNSIDNNDTGETQEGDRGLGT
ncbi:sensor histidine kinase [Alkalitalea saponilacus]|uniref:histidine kinase n=1 Tax=Alkalitalea saponilacus TaxID=889453 RepID=A0A1T5HL07_9BACT|nr:HAMP domain-containing sensor histidine kinase [Alkalitalea saponilacus]ASB47798.1 hypothetical protein CDL62_00845 [Alkalitalea saponilacus]SKC21326.1 Signal transduction histidine kinase [Alkalitalea saponilacus]